MNWPWRGSRSSREGLEAPRASEEGEARVFLVGQDIPGGYRVREVHQGGMGTVYVVTHREAEHPLVLKTYQHVSPASRPMFFKEAQAWIDLGLHPNIVEAQWVQEIQGNVYVCAEYVGADSLGRNSLLDYMRRGPIPVERLVIWAAELLYALKHMSSMGIQAHRDLKPANVMIEASGTLKVTDFGLVRADWGPRGESGMRSDTVGVWESDAGTIVGTPPYMAPEQITSPARVDLRSDLYSLGVVLLEAATGENPFAGATADECFRRHLRGAKAATRSPLDRLLFRCVQREPDARPQSATEALEIVQQVAAEVGVPMPPLPPSDVDKSEGPYRQALSLSSLGRPDEARLRVRQYLELRPDDYRGWTQLGRLMLESGDLDRAQEATEQSLEINPTNSHAWNNLGVIHSRCERWSDAEGALKRAVENDPSNTGAMLNLCTPLLRIGRPLEAVQCLENAIRVEPGKASLWANLGAVNLEIGDVESGVSALRKALQIQPDLMEARRNLERALEMRRRPKADAALLIKQERFEEARHLLQEQTEEDPSSIDSWHNLGIVYLKLGDSRAAIAAFNRVAELAPSEDFAREQLIRLLGGLGDFDGALHFCEELKRIPRGRSRAISMKAQLLYARGDKLEAKRGLRAEIAADATLDSAMWILSELHERDGELGEALQVAQSCRTALLKQGGSPGKLQDVEQRIRRLSRGA